MERRRFLRRIPLRLKDFLARILNERRNNFLFVLGLLAIVAALWAAYLRIWKGYVWASWTGFGDYVGPVVGEGQVYVRGKSLWDLLELLIVPIVLAIVVVWFDRSERKSDREIALERQREDNLQAYLDKMADLLLNDDLLRRSADPGEPVRNVAQTLTTTILRTLDANRRNLVFQFHRDVGLSKSLLVKASLWKIDLSDTNVSGIVLSGTNLSGANLSGANLIEANLSEANLSGANLKEANLKEADLSGASLGVSDLSGANLIKASLRGADLRGADLRGAYLSEAELFEANLSGADLSGTNLAGAKLKAVSLFLATVSEDQLSAAILNKDTTLPDGTKYNIGR